MVNYVSSPRKLSSSTFPINHGCGDSSLYGNRQLYINHGGDLCLKLKRKDETTINVIAGTLDVWYPPPNTFTNLPTTFYALNFFFNCIYTAKIVGRPVIWSLDMICVVVLIWTASSSHRGVFIFFVKFGCKNDKLNVLQSSNLIFPQYSSIINCISNEL